MAEFTRGFTGGARRGGGLAQLHPAARDTRAARGRALIRGERRIAFYELDAADRNFELLGDHLAHGDAMTGTQVDLA